ncbi:hypothetical protein LguiB_025832 [Lonicera macranthoides]
MCVTTFTDEYTFSDIPKSRLFKALALDSHNLIPKIIPEAIKSIQLSRGNGGAGTIKQINLAQGDTHVKYYVDALNEDECVYTYSLIEGDQLTDKLEKITYEVQFKTLENGGAVSKVTSKYYTVGDFAVDEEEVRVGKEKAWGTYRLVEAYLMQNLDAYV